MQIGGMREGRDGPGHGIPPGQIGPAPEKLNAKLLYPFVGLVRFHEQILSAPDLCGCRNAPPGAVGMGAVRIMVWHSSYRVGSVGE